MGLDILNIKATEPAESLYAYAVVKGRKTVRPDGLSFIFNTDDAIKAWGEAVQAEARREGGTPQKLKLVRYPVHILSASISFRNVATLDGGTLNEHFAQAAQKNGLEALPLTARATLRSGDKWPAQDIECHTFYSNSYHPMQDAASALENARYDMDTFLDPAEAALSTKYYISQLCIEPRPETVTAFPLPQQTGWESAVAGNLKLAHRIR